jgi:hypothetical protein
MIELTVNGLVRQFDGDPEMPPFGTCAPSSG